MVPELQLPTKIMHYWGNYFNAGYGTMYHKGEGVTQDCCERMV